jgi:hypothetical protein
MCNSTCAKQSNESILLPGSGDIDPICLPGGGALAQLFFSWGGPGRGEITAAIDWYIEFSQ